MNCSECRDLYRTYERARTGYIEALCAPFYRISREIAAWNHVNLERRKNDLQEHQLACPWAIASEFLGRQRIGLLPQA